MTDGGPSLTDVGALWLAKGLLTEDSPFEATEGHLIDENSLWPIASPSKLLCERLSDRMNTLRCQMAVPGLSQTFKENWWSAKRPPWRAPQDFLGANRITFLLRVFRMGKTAAPAPPLPLPLLRGHFVHLCGVAVTNFLGTHTRPPAGN